ncbi:SLC13 family permease [Verrucomicrobiaceae bacterium 227]
MPEAWHQPAVFLLLIGTFLLFWKDRLSVELISLLAAGILLISGILTPPEVLKCFANPAPVTIGALFILTAALERTGQIERLGGVFNKLARGSERRALFLILVGCILLSAFVNNTPLVAILLPVIMGFCRESGAKPSKLLIPLSFATILGGTCSLAGTSTNILVSGMAREQGIASLSLFSIAPLGLIYAAVGGLYLWFVAPRLLPNRETLSTLISPGSSREFLLEALLPAGSTLIGQNAESATDKHLGKMRILQIRRHGEILPDLLENLTLREGDRLLIRTGTKGVANLKQSHQVRIGLENADLVAMEETEAVLLEGMLGPGSGFVGETLGGIGFRRNFGILVLAIHREGANITNLLREERLQFADTLLVQGSRESIERLKQKRGFISLSEPQAESYNRKKAPLAIAGFGIFIVLASFPFAAIGLPGIAIDTFSAAFLAALFVLLTGCLKSSEAYHAVDWRILLLIIGMLALGGAMEKTGAALTMANGLTAIAGPLGPWGLLCGIYLLASILTELVSNNAVAVVLTPIVVQLAHTLDVSPLPFLIAVMFGASASFATPIGYQTNTYVFGAGGYRFSDFVKVGLPLNFLLWITASLFIPLIWPF